MNKIKSLIIHFKYNSRALAAEPYFYAILHYTFIFISAGLVLWWIGILNITNLQNGLENWDSFWYKSIKQEGYVFKPDSTCNLAFFPLFPAIWGLLNANSTYICIFNGAIYIFSLGYFSKQLKLNYPQVLFFLGTGSALFYFLPYSESLFFLFGTLMLVGFKKENRHLIYTAMFLISMTRAVTVVFIPIIIFTELLSQKKFSEKLSRICITIFVASMGTVISGFFQFLQTGKFLYFMEVQKYWRRTFSLPIRLPLTTYSPGEIMSIDSTALCVGAIAILLVIRELYIQLFRQPKSEYLRSYQLFSIAYLSLVTIIDVTFTFYDKDSTNIWSINRHLFCTPFYIVLGEIIFNKKLSTFFGMIIIMLVPSVFVLTVMKDHIFMTVLYFGFFAHLSFLKIGIKKLLIVNLFAVINIIFQLFLLIHFTNGGWVG